MADPMNMINWISDRAKPYKKWQDMSEEDQALYYPVGVLHKEEDRPEYTDTYQKLIDKLQAEIAASK